VYGFYSSNKGASAQLGILALGPIQEFESYGLNSADNTLKFANTAATKGEFATPHACPLDYWSDYSTSLGGKNANLSSPSWNNDGDFRLNGNGLISPGKYYLPRPGGSGNFPHDRKLRLFVNGDLLIRDNIVETKSSTWSDISAMQSITLIVLGDIKIHKDVTRIDANLIAQPNGASGGTISTCSEDENSDVSQNLLYSDCNNQLTINGAVVAKTIKWQRTFGSRSDADNSEYPGGPANVCNINVGSQSTNNVCASEVINFTPEVYMSGGVSNGREQFQTDAISILPPIL
jgi:hypothetical protein